jgi:hypothetical protein
VGKPTKNMSDTPKTDSHTRKHLLSGEEIVPASLCRELERENAEMKRLYDAWPWRQWVLRMFFGTASALMLGMGVATVSLGDGFGFAFLAGASVLAVTCWCIPRNPLSA